MTDKSLFYDIDATDAKRDACAALLRVAADTIENADADDRFDVTVEVTER